MCRQHYTVQKIAQVIAQTHVTEVVKDMCWHWIVSFCKVFLARGGYLFFNWYSRLAGNSLLFDGRISKHQETKSFLGNEKKIGYSIRIPIKLHRFSVACIGLAYRVNEWWYTILQSVFQSAKPVLKKHDIYRFTKKPPQPIIRPSKKIYMFLVPAHFLFPGRFLFSFFLLVFLYKFRFMFLNFIFDNLKLTWILIWNYCGLIQNPIRWPNSTLFKFNTLRD
jgi:hypothetical protein